MFVSAGLELKVHSCSDESIDTFPVQQSSSHSKITKVSICNDNTYIAFLRENEKPQILSAKDKQNVRLIHTINVSNVSAITFRHNTKKTIALGTVRGDVILYDTKARTIFNTIHKVADNVKTLDFTCDDQQLCGLDGDTLLVFPDINVKNDVLKYKQPFECTCLKCHSFIPNRVAIGCKDGRISLWDVQRGIEIFSTSIFNCSVSGIAMSSCGNFLVVSGTEVKICGIDLNSGNCSFQFHLEQEKEVTSLDLSPDDRFLAVGLCNGTLKLYDVKQQLKQLFSAKIHQGPVGVIAFENKAKELNSNFSSMIKISEQEIKLLNEGIDINSSDVNSTVKSCDGGSRNVEFNKDDALEKMKKSILKIIKNEIDSLENQLQEHCVKFQKFLDNEFETIDNIIKKKWDVFNGGDMNQIIKAICPDDNKSNCG